MGARAPNKRQMMESIEKPFADDCEASLDYKLTKTESPKQIRTQARKKRALNQHSVNYHTRDLNSFPFFNYGDMS